MPHVGGGMMFRKILILFLILPVFPAAAAKSAVVGRIAVTPEYEYNGKIGIRIDVYDIKVGGMKGQQVHFGFNLFQKKWLNQWVGLDAENVETETREWKGQVAWFFYNYDLLARVAPGKEPIKGVFFIVDTATGKEIGKKEIVIPAREKPEPLKPETEKPETGGSSRLEGIWSGGCWTEKAPVTRFEFRSDGSVEAEYKLKKYSGKYTVEGTEVRLQFKEKSLPGSLTLSGDELKDEKCWSLKRAQ